MSLNEWGTIIGSSKDWGVNEVLIHFEGRRPTDQEINRYIKDIYNAHGLILDYDISEPSDFRELPNPGSIVVRL